MQSDKELMQMALDALEVVTARMLDCRDELAERGGRPQTNVKHRDLWDLAFLAYTKTAIPTAGHLRARLAQPEPEPPCKTGSQCVGGKCERCAVQEPVAWCIVENGRVHGLVKSKPAVMNAEKWQPLYTAPPQREWQGLTRDEISKIWSRIEREGDVMHEVQRFARAIEAALKAKNA